MKRISFLSAPVLLTIACGSSSVPGEEATATAPAQFVGVMNYGNCTPNEKTKLDAAAQILVEITGTQFSAGAKYKDYEACLSSAALVEDRGFSGVQIADALRTNKVTGIWCWDLPSNVVAQAWEKPNFDEEVYFNKTFIASLSPREIAGTIGHELMHNRSFLHEENDFGTPRYPNTVPNQVKACIETGVPNAMALLGDPAQFGEPTNQSRGTPSEFKDYFADVNGDNIADWIQVSRTTNLGRVGLGTGSGNFARWSNESTQRGAEKDFQHYFADVNGDGRADWIQVSRTTNDGRVGLGMPNGNFQHWTNQSTSRGAEKDFQHFFADVNGDGRADWIQVSRTTNDGWVGLGMPNGDFQHWTNHSTGRGAANDYQHYFADVNGDGRADWVQVSRTANAGWIGLGDASGNFNHWTRTSTEFGAANAFEHHFVDTNGDKRADWIQSSRTLNNAWSRVALP